METTPNEAPVAPEVKSEATPNTTPEPAQAPDMHGFTSEQLADMEKFFKSQGGYEKVKSRISNPQNYSEPKVEQNVLNTPAPKVEAQAQPSQASEPYMPPTGAMTLQEVALENYFENLAKKEKYAGIAKEIASGEILNEMQNLGIRAVNRDGSINPKELFGFLDLKAQTVVAKQTSATPEASAAPTVDYVPFDEKNMNMQQAMAILQQDSALRRSGKAGNPDVAKAEEYMKNILNSKK